jgi:hypothetical protein
VVTPLGRQARRLLRPSMPPGYELLAQRPSVTGLVSVVEDHNRGLRFLTCDHSVLGGMYTSAEFYGENIFAQFHVHEAVRLTVPPTERADERAGGTDGRALCIGVGIGVVARALAALGSHVDAVELDGAVAEYARTYFDLRVPVVVEDARTYVTRAAAEVASGARPPYDYVVHDVFTGGAVPVALFRTEFFRALAGALGGSGVLAVNFVGATDGGGGARAAAARAAVAAVGARLGAAFAHVRASDAKNTMFATAPPPSATRSGRGCARTRWPGSSAMSCGVARWPRWPRGTRATA